MFAAITPALALGAAADRARIFPALIFIFVWTTIVYDPIAYWTWAPNGWLLKLGSLDFAGGTPVHISSGFAALAFSVVVGHRRQKDHSQPHNLGYVILGTSLLWFGWFGFNGGSSLNSTARTGMAMIVTNLAAACGGLTWMCLDAFNSKKFSALSFCVGAVAGLVAITPASGFVVPWSAVVFGVVGGSACRFATSIQHKLNIDDSLDVWAVHGVGGFVGNVLTGVFAQEWVVSLDGTTPQPGGWLNQIWIQVPIQLAASAAGALVLLIMDRIPGLRLRVNEVHEILGIDQSQMGETAFTMPFTGLERESGIESNTENEKGKKKETGSPMKGKETEVREKGYIELSDL
ncbi:hypothetical protein HK096_007632, partial [Nowakowskiella sp. JEL0078]